MIRIVGKHKAGRAKRLDDGCGRADHSIAVEILLEAGLERLQRCAAARYGRRIRQKIAVDVGIPDVE